jgi:hypothetical protein
VEDEEDVFNEEHSRIIQELEEVLEDTETLEVLKVPRVGKYKGKRIIPNECAILEC